MHAVSTVSVRSRRCSCGRFLTLRQSLCDACQWRLACKAFTKAKSAAVTFPLPFGVWPFVPGCEVGGSQEAFNAWLVAALGDRQRGCA